MSACALAARGGVQGLCHCRAHPHLDRSGDITWLACSNNRHQCQPLTQAATHRVLAVLIISKGSDPPVDIMVVSTVNGWQSMPVMGRLRTSPCLSCRMGSYVNPWERPVMAYSGSKPGKACRTVGIGMCWLLGWGSSREHVLAAGLGGPGGAGVGDGKRQARAALLQMAGSPPTPHLVALAKDRKRGGVVRLRWRRGTGWAWR